MDARTLRIWRPGALRAALEPSSEAQDDVRERASASSFTPRSQTELQQDVQRFAGRFTDRVAQAAELLAEGADRRRCELALRRALLYEGAVLDIATGPVPELNLLDAVVFASLIRAAFETYWLPAVFSDEGAGMLDALRVSEVDAWELADKYLSAEHAAQLRAQIQAWRDSHPEQFRVESVRLSDFSELAAKADRRQNSQGLFGNVKVATQAADQALLLGERALFWGQRAPTLLRTQARLGAYEIASDCLIQVERGEQLMARGTELLAQARELAPLLSEATQLVLQVSGLTAEARGLVGTLEAWSAPLLAARPQRAGPPLTALEEVAKTCAQLGSSLQMSAQSIFNPELGGPAHWLAGADRLLRRLAFYAVCVGVLWALAFWLGYWLVRG